MTNVITIQPESIDPIPVNIGKETFSAFPIGIMAYMDFLRVTKATKDEAEQGLAMFELFRTCMDPEEYNRFVEFAKVPRNGVSVRVMLELITALVEKSAASPSEPSSPSQNGETPTGDGSKDG